MLRRGWNWQFDGSKYVACHGPYTLTVRPVGTEWEGKVECRHEPPAPPAGTPDDVQRWCEETAANRATAHADLPPLEGLPHAP